ncbi:SDR family oxidoreductase [Micromonospora mirobrigensis]|uniref:NAD(P)-dependent dehydrogenase, short-chain alcohol dehydrogenase family n=1 Tax=Micromonospora mirobrigensis TaxID=262898 RepID=A0A1C4UCL8_9ACTN|nr:SDR family oxidoreductase [Micromonospora mirobrigensis]SCE69401.1 NAD(P)-dependent dehydrogenase, short-chain alcohol dehydrogenase family [Micromonospora mirobrigensis]
MTTKTIALVTGANKGIGYATARQLGALGMTVLVGARDTGRGREAERTLRAGGADARFVPLDVTDEASVAAAAKLVEQEYDHLDVLVNNAGIVRADGSALPSETTLATMREVYETNVFGPVAVTNAFLPLLRRAPAARIVNVSSEVGSIAAMTNPEGALAGLTSVPYPSSKTALNMITAMYAKELRDTPIRINAANPGYCATDFNSHAGFRTAEEGAEVSVHLATLPADGPTGLLWGFRMDEGGDYGVLPW